MNHNPSIHEITATQQKLPIDLRKAAATLGRDEARFLVNLYYDLQESRKSSANQQRSLGELPHATIAYFADQFFSLERQVQGALDTYTKSDPLGAWARKTVGVGPVIAAGLLAHIDISRAPTVGHIWSFAGLNPEAVWKKGERRPWNAQLKVLAWKLGDSFVKVSGNEKSLYGSLYRKRKTYELERDARGENAEAAESALSKKNIKEPKVRGIYESGHLPAGQLDARARRWAVKLFLAHYHHAAYRVALGQEPPKPYVLEHVAGHAHLVVPEVDLPALRRVAA